MDGANGSTTGNGSRSNLLTTRQAEELYAAPSPSHLPPMTHR